MLIKLWFSVTQSEQRTRFMIRQIDPVRRWKLSPTDLASLDKWDAYTEAKEAMFFYTDTEHAPWTVVKSNDKKRARINALRHVLHTLDYTGKNTDPDRRDRPADRRPGVRACTRPASTPGGCSRSCDVERRRTSWPCCSCTASASGEPDYAGSAIRALRKEFARSTNDRGGRRRSDHRVGVLGAGGDGAGGPVAARGAFPDRVGGWFSGLNNLTHRISNGSSLSLVPLALSGLVRHVPGIPRIHWPTLRWAVSNFVGDIVAYQVTPEQPGGLRRGARLRRRGAAPAGGQGAGRAAGRGRAQPGQRHRRPTISTTCTRAGGRRGDTPLERGETFTSFYTLGSPIALWMERYGDFSRPVQIPGKTSDGPGDRGGRRVDQLLRRRRRAGLPVEGAVRGLRQGGRRGQVGVGRRPADRACRPVSHVAYWNDKAVLRPIANSLAWLWNARRDPHVRAAGRGIDARRSARELPVAERRSSMLRWTRRR